MVKLLFFTGSWCIPCKTYLPKVKACCEQHGVQIEIVDVTERFETANKYNVKSVPTIMLLDNEKIHYQRSGVMSDDMLNNLIGNADPES